MTNLPFFGLRRLCIGGLLAALAGGCALLDQKSAPQPTFYSLDTAATAVPPPTRAAAAPPGSALTLIINPPHASAGFDSKRIIYVRQDHKLEYYAHSQWADTPARMVAPLVVAAAEASGAFRAVVLTPSAATGDLRLDTEIVRLQHDFASQPSRVRFTLRAYIVDNTTRRVLASREIDESEAAASEDAYGGVVAANRAVQAALRRLAALCAEAAGNIGNPPPGVRASAPTRAPSTP